MPSCSVGIVTNVILHKCGVINGTTRFPALILCHIVSVSMSALIIGLPISPSNTIEIMSHFPASINASSKDTHYQIHQPENGGN
jgi:hypothetical protein